MLIDSCRRREPAIDRTYPENLFKRYLISIAIELYFHIHYYQHHYNTFVKQTLALLCSTS